MLHRARLGGATRSRCCTRDVCGGSHDGLLAVHSLSKRSNLAGYRAGLVAGDPALVGDLLALRKHLGMMRPRRSRRRWRPRSTTTRTCRSSAAVYAAGAPLLRPALRGGRLPVDHSEAGLYLWATRGEPCWDTLRWLADRGILVAPGDFYGAAGAEHVRVALTATDERIEAAATRLG